MNVFSRLDAISAPQEGRLCFTQDIDNFLPSIVSFTIANYDTDTTCANGRRHSYDSLQRWPSHNLQMKVSSKGRVKMKFG
jgi:hypothetical protein